MQTWITAPGISCGSCFSRGRSSPEPVLSQKAVEDKGYCATSLVHGDQVGSSKNQRQTQGPTFQLNLFIKQLVPKVSELQNEHMHKH